MDFFLLNVFVDLKGNMNLIILRIKTFFFSVLITKVRKDCRQSPKEFSEALDYI